MFLLPTLNDNRFLVFGLPPSSHSGTELFEPESLVLGLALPALSAGLKAGVRGGDWSDEEDCEEVGSRGTRQALKRLVE